MDVFAGNKLSVYQQLSNDAVDKFSDERWIIKKICCREESIDSTSINLL